MKDIKVLILGGGDSTRYWPLGDKLFMTYLGRPLLYYRLNQLYKNGFKNIYLIAGSHNLDKYKLFKNKFPEFSFNIIIQKDKRGMAGAVLSAEDSIKNSPLLIIKPSDLFEDSLFSHFLKSAKTEDIILTGFTSQNYFPGGYLTVKDGYLQHIVEKPDKDNLPSSMTRLVFDYFKDSSLFLNYLKKASSTKDDLYEVALENMAKDKHKLYVLNYSGFWGQLQYPWNALNISSYYLSKIKNYKGQNVQIAKGAVLKGNVYLEDGVKILENSKIIGPTYIGKNTLIGNNVIIRDSMIGDNCIIGFTTEITRSLIGNNNWFHTNYIGDSIMSDNIALGAGAVIANFRLDESEIYSSVGHQKLNTNKIKLGAAIGENTRIGVNSSIMPGIKIGKNCVIGSGLVISRDINDYNSCFLKPDLQIQENKNASKTKSRENLKTALKF